MWWWNYIARKTIKAHQSKKNKPKHSYRNSDIHTETQRHVRTYHQFHPVVFAHICACMACRTHDELSNQDESRRSTAVPDWLLHMPLATPPGRTGRKTHLSPVKYMNLLIGQEYMHFLGHVQNEKLLLTILPTIMILGPSCLWTANIWMSLSVKTI